MRFSNNKIIKSTVKKSIDYTIETKNAILWDHLPAQRICRVKIQGSDKYVIAYYPEGWHMVPYWLKPGAPVRIAHVGGIRGRIEVVGIGQTIPTTTGSALPEPDDDIDSIINGLNVTQIPNSPQMAVMVYVGEYRIDGVIYTLTPIKMSATSNYIFGMGGAMDQVAAVVDIDAAPSTGYFRYDLIVVGTDGIVDYVKGDVSDTSPEVPEGHIQLAKILITSETTAIYNDNIGKLWTERVPTKLNIEYTGVGQEMDWGEIYSGIEVTVLDQYGGVLNRNPADDKAWYMTLTFLSGNGQIKGDSRYASWSEEETFDEGAFYDEVSTCCFSYWRPNDGNDISPKLEIKLETNFALTEQVSFVLYDALGEIMT